MLKEGVRRGWKEPEKRLVRVDIVVGIEGGSRSVEVVSVVG